MKEGIAGSFVCASFTIGLLLSTVWNGYTQHASSVSTGDKIFAKNELPQKSLAKSVRVNSGRDIEIIRKRIIDDLLAPNVNTDAIKQLVKAIKADGSWTDIYYTDTSR